MAIAKSGTTVSSPLEPEPGDGARRRRFLPRPPVIVRPSFVSDETSFAVLGITPRKFRERIVPRCDRVTRLGHTVAVELEEAERIMRTIATLSDDAHEIEDDDADDDVPLTADAVLARLGREPVAR